MAQSRYEMWGESLREVGLLLLVFGPLDALVEHFHDYQPVSFKEVLFVSFAVLAGLGLMTLGVEWEGVCKMWLIPIGTFALSIGVITFLGFRDKAKQLRKHQEKSAPKKQVSGLSIAASAEGR